MEGLRSKKRGRKAQPVNPLEKENQRLRRETERLQRRLVQAEKIIEVQKKVSEILGIPLDREQSDERTS